ncbi:uncharacterized protein LOC110974316 isoform X2 [Acanthaster planci]|uniref:Uncharacterized protein LOC110974316 isoform X2 n=1 Tax=Acanthaster planci TaxID=133434 RepID=A0A8B7XL91_ACAPL|nr:uncharacterized protein LOC110974316 isoform X2 [Acanthaster planci]
MPVISLSTVSSDVSKPGLTMAGHGEQRAPLVHTERLGPFSTDDFSSQVKMDKHHCASEAEATTVISMDVLNVDPLSTLECLEMEASPGRLSGATDDLSGPVATIREGRFVDRSDHWDPTLRNSDPLSTLEHLERIDADYDDPLNTADPYAKILKSQCSEKIVHHKRTGLDENGGSLQPHDVHVISSQVKPSLGLILSNPCDGGAKSRELPVPDPKLSPGYTPIHRRQPQRCEVTPEMDQRISRVATILQAEYGLSNTNQSNQGLAGCLGYIEDGYSTISKYRDEGEDAEVNGHQQPPPTVEGGSHLQTVMRQHKNPAPECRNSTARYSSCVSALEINTSRQKLLRDDKVRFGTLDPRKLEDVTQSKFVDGRYVNPWDTWREPSAGSALKFFCMRSHSGVPSKEVLEQTLPVLTPDPSKIDTPPTSGINVTWIGHASLLVQFDGVSILTDPIFSSFCGPASLVGYKRFRPVPCTIGQLPRIHAVVISHSHYDHLDLPTVQALNSRFGSDLRWFVPLGMKDWFTRTGVEDVIELDWWQENCIPTHPKVTFAFTPTQHWSMRTGLDRCKSLWGSWSVIGPNHSFYFAGDTGYCKAFKEIGQRYGPFDVAAIPIGAYKPRSFLAPQHVDPTQAVQIHLDVQARQSVAIHWGTFRLGKEHYLAPREDLKIAVEEVGLAGWDFSTLKHGETRLFAEEEDQTVLST